MRRDGCREVGVIQTLQLQVQVVRAHLSVHHSYGSGSGDSRSLHLGLKRDSMVSAAGKHRILQHLIVGVVLQHLGHMVRQEEHVSLSCCHTEDVEVQFRCLETYKALVCRHQLQVKLIHTAYASEVQRVTHHQRVVRRELAACNGLSDILHTALAYLGAKFARHVHVKGQGHVPSTIAFPVGRGPPSIVLHTQPEVSPHHRVARRCAAVASLVACHEHKACAVGHIRGDVHLKVVVGREHAQLRCRGGAVKAHLNGQVDVHVMRRLAAVGVHVHGTHEQREHIRIVAVDIHIPLILLHEAELHVSTREAVLVQQLRRVALVVGIGILHAAEILQVTTCHAGVTVALLQLTLDKVLDALA